MIRKIFLLPFLCFWTSTLCFAQVPLQTVRGVVLDEDTQLPLVGATIVILNTEPIIGATADNEGVFKFDSVPIGRVSLRVSYLGYTEKQISNIEVNSAKEVVLEIRLVESSTRLDEVVIAATQKKGTALNDLALVSSRSISAEQTSRFAGGFNDPSKITTNFAGVTTQQDGGNEIIVRGNSPKYIQWRLEGAEITNPNHFGDQNAVSGIVGALNNNLLSTSDFYTGAFPAQFGDAFSGIYDVRMRKGNNEKFEGIFGLGILGTDITLEGPFKKGYGGSYLVNFRYSTVGLATDLGLVSVEDANITFQDAAFKIWLPTEKLGTFSIFGLQGNSSFVFEDVDPSVWVTPGNDFVETTINEDYEKGANLLNTGINHIANISPKSYLKTVFIYSREGIQDDVFDKLYSPDSTLHRRMNFGSDIAKSAYKLNSIYHHKINARHKLVAGIQYNLLQQNMVQSQLDTNNDRISLIDFDKNINSFSSFINWKFSPNEKWTMVAGLHNTNVLLNNKHTIEPRLAFDYKLNRSSSVNFGFGLHSRMESIHNYFAKVEQPNGTFTTPNTDLGLLKAAHYVLGYEKYFGKNNRLRIETYYQDLYNIPVEDNKNSSYSTCNEGLELNYVNLVNEGTGKNYGIEITFERFLNNGLYYLANTSVYQSKYTALDGVERNTRFNGNYLLNLLAGKEFSGLGKKNNQIFAVNVKAFFGGGKPILPLLRDHNGQLAVDTESGLVFDQSKAYESKLDNIVSIVGSLSYKWNKKRTTHELFLNIDNLTNNQARLKEFYDANAESEIGYEKQVGIVPNILYRIYF